jgi:hypothetical protein
MVVLQLCWRKTCLGVAVCTTCVRHVSGAFGAGTFPVSVSPDVLVPLRLRCDRKHPWVAPSLSDSHARRQPRQQQPRLQQQLLAAQHLVKIGQ